MYKPYKVNSFKHKTPEPTFIQDEIKNLKKYMKFIQALTKTTLFYLPPYYKSLQPQGEQDKQYWQEIAVTFLKKRHNVKIKKGFPIEMYIEELPHKPYFIMLTLWGQIIIGPMKKLVTTYVVGDLVLLD